MKVVIDPKNLPQRTELTADQLQANAQGVSEAATKKYIADFMMRKIPHLREKVRETKAAYIKCSQLYQEELWDRNQKADHERWGAKARFVLGDGANEGFLPLMKAYQAEFEGITKAMEKNVELAEQTRDRCLKRIASEKHPTTEEALDPQSKDSLRKMVIRDFDEAKEKEQKEHEARALEMRKELTYKIIELVHQRELQMVTFEAARRHEVCEIHSKPLILKVLKEHAKGMLDMKLKQVEADRKALATRTSEFKRIKRERPKDKKEQLDNTQKAFDQRLVKHKNELDAASEKRQTETTSGIDKICQGVFKIYKEIRDWELKIVWILT
mgnify:CR=1 FL=1